MAGINILSSLPNTLLGEWLATGSLSRSTPEFQGLSSAIIIAFVNAVEKEDLGLHSLMVNKPGFKR